MIYNTKNILKITTPIEIFTWMVENTHKILEFDDRLSVELIEKYKYKWNYRGLSFNSNITEKFILKYLNKNWDIYFLISKNRIINFKALSKSNNINQSILYKYPDKPWDWEWLIENRDIKIEYNKNISMNLIKKYKYKWNYKYLSYNPNLTEEFILKYPHQNWDIEYLIENNKITDFNVLSKFKEINQDIIDKYSNKPWDWEWLSENTNICINEFDCCNTYYNYSHKSYITEEIILKYPYQNWDIEYLIDCTNKIINFNALTKFKYINQNIIDKYPDKPWDWEWLIKNTNINVEKYISIDLIEKYLYKWNCWNLSYNPNLIEEFILKCPYKEWNINYLIKNNKITNFKALSKFKNIQKQNIFDYKDKPWDWEWLIDNNNNIKIESYIPFYLIKKYKWNYWYLSYNLNIPKNFILHNIYQNWNIKYLIKNNKKLEKIIFYKI